MRIFTLGKKEVWMLREHETPDQKIVFGVPGQRGHHTPARLARGPDGKIISSWAENLINEARGTHFIDGGGI